MRHHQPNHRPIHPECPALIRKHAACECGLLWDYWDGSPGGLIDSIRTQESLEARRSPRRAPRAAMPDDLELDVDIDKSDDEEEDSLHGFWKESERLRTTQDNRQ